MENTEAKCLVKLKRCPTRPLHPETRKYYKKILNLRKNNPELFKLELAKIDEKLAKKKRMESKPIMEDRETRRARLAAEGTGPVKVVFIPQTIQNTSEVKTCDTKYEAEIYMKLANTDPRDQVFMVLNPRNGKPDEDFTKRVIDLYRKDQCGVTAMATSVDVQGTSFVLKRHHAETGETMVPTFEEVLATASVLKSHHEDLGKSSETVVDVPRTN